MPLIRILQSDSCDLLAYVAVFRNGDGSYEAVSGERVQLSDEDGESIFSAIERGERSGIVAEYKWALDGVPNAASDASEQTLSA